MDPDDLDDVRFPITTRKELLHFNNILIRGKGDLTIPLVQKHLFVSIQDEITYNTLTIIQIHFFQANYLADKLSSGTLQTALTILFSPRLSLQIWHAGRSHPNQGHSAGSDDEEELNEALEAAEAEGAEASLDKNRPTNLGRPPANIQDFAPEDLQHQAYWFRMVSIRFFPSKIFIPFTHIMLICFFYFQPLHKLVGVKRLLSTAFSKAVNKSKRGKRKLRLNPEEWMIQPPHENFA